MKWPWGALVNFIYVDVDKAKTKPPTTRLTKRMYWHRAAYIVLVISVCGLIYGCAFWLYQENWTGPKSYVAFFTGYKIEYDYSRYLGESRLAAVEHVLLPNTVDAAPKPAGFATSVPVLLYHRIATDHDEYNVTPAAFEAQMFTLKKAGYQTVSAEDYADFIQGTKKLPAKSVLLTFDDGTKDSYYPVDPILKALGFRATTFVITRYSVEDYAGSHYYLSEIELKAMERTGRWDIEPHAKNGHTYYQVAANGRKGEYYPNKLWLASKHRMETDAEYAQRVENDMTVAKREIENLTHQPANVFAFPFADIGANGSSNYKAAPTILTNDVEHLFKESMLLYYAGRDRSQGYYNSNVPYTYRIQVLYGQWVNGQGLLSFLQEGTAKPLPYTDSFKTDQGWRNAWGEDTVQHGKLTISSTKSDSTGAGIVLDGSSGWSNYHVSARVTLDKGRSFALLARLQGSDYRIGCYYEASDISISRNAGSSLTVLDETGTPAGVNFSKPQNLTLTVDGDHVACYLNGTLVANAVDATMPPTGGIGFSVYDPKKPSVLSVQNLTVTAL